LWLAVPAAAQVAPAPPAETIPSDADVLAFGFADTRMTVPVSIAGAGPYRFVIDTGAERTVISHELVRLLGLPRGRDVTVTSVTGSTVEGTAVIPSISVSSFKGKQVEAPAFAGVNIGAAGMLGIDTLQGQAVVIDFDKQEMAVRASSRRATNVAQPGEIVVQAKSLFGQLVVTDAFVNGRRVRVVLDTGSAVSMGNLALRRRLAKRRGGAPEPVQLTSVTGAHMTADGGSLERLKIGDLTISRLPVAYADAPPFRRFGLADTPAMLLGMDALALFRRVEIDFANRTLRLALPRELASR
jgi:predicted aspartyl protease